MADIIAYIDGFNLYHGLRDRYQHRYLWLDVVQLVGRLRPRTPSWQSATSPQPCETIPPHRRASWRT